jgi:hypothetical protein
MRHDHTPTPWVADEDDNLTVCSQRRPAQRRALIARFERPEDCAYCLKAVNHHLDLATALDNLCDALVRTGVNIARHAELSRAYHIGRKAVAEAKT